MKDVCEIIERILDEKGQVYAESITAMTTFVEIGLTSFDLATLTVMIEDRYDVDIFENGLVYNVGQILELIENNE